MNVTADKQKIGIVFNFRKGWHGGIIYIINIINSLNFLEEEDQPEVIVFYNPDLKEYLKEMIYPNIKFVQWDFPGFYKGYLTTWLTRKNIFVEDMITQYQLDGVYPVNDRPIAGSKKISAKIIAWLPDLQHKFYPHFFGWKRVFFRDFRFKLILKNTNDLVVSSGDVRSHFYKFYTIKDSLKIHTLRFVSIMDNFTFPELEVLAGKYNIPARYYIVSNSFTNHKNHLVIIEALVLLKKAGVPIHFVFTGKPEFKGNEEYIKKIRTMVAENQLESYVSFLGVIPRQDQLVLMKNSIAVVQPSLFEGWSTVIEDAKTLQVPVIASDLPVNIEQLEEKGTYFSPHDAKGLAAILSNYSKQHSDCQYEPYDKRVRDFAKAFINIFK